MRQQLTCLSNTIRLGQKNRLKNRFNLGCLIGKRWKYSAASFLAAVRSLGELLADEASQPGGMAPRSHRPARDIIPPFGERGR